MKPPDRPTVPDVAIRLREYRKRDGCYTGGAVHIVVDDPNWEQHPGNYSAYTFDRFEQDWSRTSAQNEYGPIHSHRIAAERYVGNVLVAGIFINGRKSDPVFLAYDPRDHTLSFSPIQLYLGP